MTRQEESTLEAEVLEIDGIAVEPKPVRQKPRTGKSWAQWGNLLGQLQRLDARWMPLWIVLGFIALVLIVSIGMVVAVFFVAWLLVKGLLRGFASLFDPPSANLQRR